MLHILYIVVSKVYRSTLLWIFLVMQFDFCDQSWIGFVVISKVWRYSIEIPCHFSQEWLSLAIIAVVIVEIVSVPVR